MLSTYLDKILSLRKDYFFSGDNRATTMKEYKQLELISIWVAICLLGITLITYNNYLAIIGILYALVFIFCFWMPNEKVMKINTFLPKYFINPKICERCERKIYLWEYYKYDNTSFPSMVCDKCK